MEVKSWINVDAAAVVCVVEFGRVSKAEETVKVSGSNERDSGSSEPNVKRLFGFITPRASVGGASG